MRSKYFVITILVICLVGFALENESHAAPAAPIMKTLEQGDDISFKARQWGDENKHGWENEDGYSIIFDESLNRWTYAVHGDDGSLISSSRIVGKDSIPDVVKHLRPKGKPQVVKRLSKELSKDSKKQSLNKAQGVVSSTGTGYIPVILINFSNTSTTYTASNFNTLLFGTGNNSMKDYYEEVSYGAFTVSGGPGGVVGWYTASNTHDYYGHDDIFGYDRWPGTLVREAVSAADSAGFNFAPYDLDGDCYVDVVMIAHQGTGEEAGGPTTDIWSHRWDLSSAYSWGYSNGGEYTTNDSCPAGGYIKVNDYVMQPETLTSYLGGGQETMGVFAHEYGHALGLPDLYDTDYSSEGIGEWSIMAGGSWNYITKPGDRPAHMDAWCKYYLGWVIPTEVMGTLTGESIAQVETTADVYKLLSGDPTSGEYYLVENRQKTGFDAGLPGAGLLIWHIDGSTIAANTDSNTVNDNECYSGGPSCSSQHYGVALVQADGRWDLENGTNSGDAGDTYPGSSNKTSFTSSTSPDSNLYSGSASNVSITNIGTSASTMYADLYAPFPVSITLSPPSNAAVSTGGKLGPFSISIKNDTSSSYSFYTYIYLVTPDGTWKYLISKLLTLSGGGTLSTNNLYMNIPSFAPTGSYYYWVGTYDMSYTLLDYDYFSFTVTAK